MANAPAQEISLEAASALALHLKRNPEEARRPAQELAAHFGLTPSFVQGLIDSIQPQPGALAPSPKIDWTPVKRLHERISHKFDQFTKDPIRFVVVTGLALILIVIGIGVAREVYKVEMVYGGMSIGRTLIAVASAIIITLHYSCYFHRAMVRFPVQGGLLMWMGTAVTLMVLNWFDLDSQRAADSRRWVEMAFTMIATFFLSMIYAGAGSLVSVLGSYWKLRKAERVRENLTRQEKLERYILLKSRLDTSETITNEKMWVDRYPITDRIRRHPFFYFGAFSLILGGLNYGVSLMMGTTETVRNGTLAPTGTQVVALGLSTVMFLVSLLSYVGAGFFARRAWRALLVCLWMYGLGALYLLLPDPVMRGNLGSNPVVVLAATGLAMVLLTMVSALGGHVQRRLAREKKLQGNDRETLMTELMQLHVELASEDLHVCVMVIDAARSSEMKAANDPLVVEYTFRLYQEWIEELSQKSKGRVHSTAGDGAVVAFDACEQALRAARAMQTDVDRFNREENKLNKPFRLRIGLHTGTISADLDEVVFTEVIDIAAHIEATAPVGGIAVSQRVADQLPDEVFLPLATEVDGYVVLLVKNPTE